MTPAANPRLRVMHVVLSLEPGGMENGIVNVANQLDPARFELSVCCLERIGSFADRLPAGVKVFCLDKPPGKSFATVRKLRQLIRREGIQLLHSHNLGPLLYSAAANFGGSAALLQGEHGQLAGRDLTPGRLRLRRWLYARCACVQTVSESLRQHLIDLGFNGRHLRAITNGVDTDRFQPPRNRAAVRETLGLSPDAFTIGIAGRLTPLKRHLFLLDAVAACRRRGLDVNLVIVGAGPEEDRIRDHIRGLELADAVVLAGHQPDPLPWYQAMDLHVLPTEQEGLSNAMLESMACAVPSIANAACGTSELIRHGENGWQIQLSTPDTLAEAICQVANDRSQLENAARQARQTVVDSFSLTAMANGYAALYRALAR